jgi:hypothetical protein
MCPSSVKAARLLQRADQVADFYHKMSWYDVDDVAGIGNLVKLSVKKKKKEKGV